MDLQPPDRKEPPESVIPMINVVFLLLIFFLISATLSPATDATPPRSTADNDRADAPLLVIERSGRPRFGDIYDDAAVAAAAIAHRQAEYAADATGSGAQSATAARGPRPSAFPLLADAEAPGDALAKAMRGLAELGVRNVALTTLRGSGAGGAPCAPGAALADGGAPC
ncbi:MAG: biopolymer transporter ExbD [Pseudomonadota bacterium]